ncbi:hypothetical protein PsorP6_007304 [Peronosclerospora sorghi]|uniref:Uncharacterized protein n=1 Tax=Peronosclerospora sorghi TaxID=230839 RepID=A0ACC0WA67_9STRA|nr:hypothetical protein PsorP6_007304 [Peronosclerospora sorghi]
MNQRTRRFPNVRKGSNRVSCSGFSTRKTAKSWSRSCFLSRRAPTNDGLMRHGATYFRHPLDLPPDFDHRIEDIEMRMVRNERVKVTTQVRQARARHVSTP